MRPIIVARSSASVAQFSKNDPPTPDCPGCGEIAEMHDALVPVAGSWNVVSLNGGADDAKFSRALYDYYLLYSVPSPYPWDGRPWAVTQWSQCPDTNSVYLRATSPTTADAVVTGLRKAVNSARTISPGIRVVDMNYPYVVARDNVCASDHGDWQGANSTVDALSDLHDTAMRGVPGVYRLDLRDLFGAENPLPMMQLTRYYGYPHVNGTGQTRIAERAVEELLAAFAR
jgi:hypothetical protein